MRTLLVTTLVTLLYLHQSEARPRIKVVASPVVFTNNNGGGQDELEVPAHSDASKLFDAEAPVASAWWVPYDNIGDLSAIHRIEVVPAGNNVKLIVHGRPGQRNGRVRIKILAEMVDNSSCY